MFCKSFFKLLKIVPKSLKKKNIVMKLCQAENLIFAFFISFLVLSSTVSAKFFFF